MTLPQFIRVTAVTAVLFSLQGCATTGQSGVPSARREAFYDMSQPSPFSEEVVVLGNDEGAVAGTMWQGKLTSVQKVRSVPDGPRQANGWWAKPGFAMVIVRGKMQAMHPSPPEAWTGHAGEMFKGQNMVLLDTRVAILEAGPQFYPMVGYLTRDTFDEGPPGDLVVWIGSFARSVPPKTVVNVAMVFTVPANANEVTVNFAGGGAAKVRLVRDQP